MTPGKWLQQLLSIMIEKQASDLLISTNAPPSQVAMVIRRIDTLA